MMFATLRARALLALGLALLVAPLEARSQGRPAGGSGGVSSTSPSAFPDGTESAPAITNLGDENTGAWFCAADAICLSTGGTERFRLTTTTLTLTLPIRAADGSAAAPPYSFTNNTNMGMYRAAVNLLGFAVGGSAPLWLSPSVIVANTPIEAPVASAAAPTYSYAGDNDTGWYRGAANSAYLSLGGADFIRTFAGQFNPAVSGAVDLGQVGGYWRALYLSQSLNFDSTDSTASPGAATINKASGKSAIANGAASVVITNSTVAATSRILITNTEDDATCMTRPWIAVAGSGSFTVTAPANCTAATNFDWLVVR